MAFFSIFLFSIFSINLQAMQKQVDPKNILSLAEKIRNPTIDYEVDIFMTDSKGGKKDLKTFKTLIKGRNKALVKFLTPEVDRGTRVLMVDDQMWVQMESTAKPIRISPRQMLMGNASYGDIVRLNFVENYTPTFLRKDTFAGRTVIVLELTAVEGKLVTYDRIEYWVDEETKAPLKALYKTDQGKILREGLFKKFAKVLGLQRPTEFVLLDYLEKAHQTTLEFRNTKKAELSEILFEKQNFGKP